MEGVGRVGGEGGGEGEELLVVADPRPSALLWSPEQLEDQVQLVRHRRAGEERSAARHLVEDAPHAPVGGGIPVRQDWTTVFIFQLLFLYLHLFVRISS